MTSLNRTSGGVGGSPYVQSGKTGDVGKPAPNAEIKASAPSKSQELDPGDRQVQANPTGQTPKTPLESAVSQQASTGQIRGPRTDRSPFRSRTLASPTNEATKVTAEASAPKVSTKSALDGFRTAPDKAEAEFTLNYPNREAQIDMAKGSMLMVFSYDPENSAKEAETNPHLQSAQKLWTEHGERLTKLSTGDDMTAFDVESAKVAAQIPTSDAIHHLKVYTPPDCGTTAQRLSPVFLGEAKGQAVNDQQQKANRAYDKGLLKVGDPPLVDGDMTSGVGADALKKHLASMTGPMYIKVDVMGKGYGHAYVLEQLPRTSDQAPLRGYLHQSFVGKHSLAQWTDHAPKGPIYLEKGHLDKLADVTNPKSGESQLKSYEKIYVRPGDPDFRDKAEKEKKPTKVQIVWTAVPFKPAEAAHNAHQKMGI